MLKKLLKYDMKWCLKVVSIYIIIGLVLAVLGRLIDLFPESVFFSVVGGICKGASISFGITAIVNAIIRAWVRMITNMYKDESYLTHTLPIKTDRIYLSKIISSITLVIICIITLLISLIVMYLNDNTIELIKTSLNIISNNLELSITGLVILLTLLIILQIINIILCGFVGIIFGHSYNNKKVPMMLLYGFGSYVVIQIINVLILILGSLFNSDLYNILFNGVETVEFSLLKGITIFCIIIYSIISFVLYYLSNKKLLKGINLD